MKINRIVFNMEYVRNGWFRKNFSRIAPGEYSMIYNNEVDTSEVFFLNKSEDDNIYFLELENE